MALLLVVAGVSMVGLLVAFAFAGAEPLRRIPGARAATIVFEWLGGATLLAILSFAALLGGGIALVVFIVGGTAAACIVLYGIAESIAYLFGISLRWGLVIACALFVVMSAAGGLIHDIRLEVMPPTSRRRNTSSLEPISFAKPCSTMVRATHRCGVNVTRAYRRGPGRPRRARGARSP
jgi:hypothetical protein